MKKFTSESQKTGELGESIVVRHLLKEGFEIIERNHTQKWGEIDIVAKKGYVTHFIEVKSVSCESFEPISHETEAVEGYRPEEQVHKSKRTRLKRVVRTYLEDHETAEWQFDVACVFLMHSRRIARIKMLNNIILT